MNVMDVVSSIRRGKPSKIAKFSVIVTSGRDQSGLERCLAELSFQDLSDVQVFVVGEWYHVSDRNLELKHPTFKFIRARSIDAAVLRNLGVENSQSEYLAFLDADTLPGPNWVEVMKAFTRDGWVAGGRIDMRVIDESDTTGAEAFDCVFAYQQEAFIERMGFAVMRNAAMSRETFDKVGKFKRGSGSHLEWCARAREAGILLEYCDEMDVSAPAMENWVAMRQKWQSITLDGFDRSRCLRFGRLRWIGKACAMPLSILVHAPRIFLNEELLGREKMRAMGVLVRLRLARMFWMLNLARHFNRNPGLRETP